MYYIVYGLLYLISLLPFFIMYKLSDFIAFLLYRVFKYRKAVVLNNLLIAFPEKSDRERKKIAKEFYRNFCDTFIETIKVLSMSDKVYDERCTGNFELINGIVKKGKNIQIFGAHKFNWEYANLVMSKNISIPAIGIYSPIENKAMDRLFLKIRSKYNTILVPTVTFRRQMPELMKGQYLMYLLADQSPSRIQHAYWLDFFGRETPFVAGPYKSASRSNTTIIFLDFRKIKRGYYSFDTKLVVEDAGNYSPEQLAIMYRNFVQDIIREQPDNYLWSHRRWKHTYNEEFKNNRIEG
ncbi:lipid A biosynthesis acyltransferase [Ferruginibacter lapsinanis]|uniref:lysophospholipid acyltransferase family protein n=1 Tax=Ferruginibacter lapsinanis TaxID=563172 RepID=UPI0021D48395|nr:lipid A biosynthesis acyltransferase [Ferruginibacter lapsinanis]UEG50434.1 lipid A biosynthesis acyltransferase [Ferruginibacter lapsinanis]